MDTVDNVNGRAATTDVEVADPPTPAAKGKATTNGRPTNGRATGRAGAATPGIDDPAEKHQTGGVDPTDTDAETASVTGDPGEGPGEAGEDTVDRPEPAPKPVKLNSRGEVDRASAIWSAKWPVIIATVAVFILVYAASSVVPAVYSSSATVSVTAASTPGGSAADVAVASNDLAAQYAQLVSTDSVLDPAAKTLGVSSSDLSSHLSSGTVAAQNLVQITTQASSGPKAQRWAQVVATAFQASVVARAKANATALQASVTAQSASLTKQIDALQAEIAASGAPAPGSAQLATLESQENQLTNLVTSRANLTSNTALAIASEEPDVTVVVSGTAPTKLSPKPLLYGIIGALIALLAGCQLAVVLARRRLNHAGA